MKLKNYFINPQTVLRYFMANVGTPGPLFAEPLLQQFEEALNQTILETVFQKNNVAFNEYQQLTEILKTVIWQNATTNIKLSAFLERVFNRYRDMSGQPILLNKGRFSELVKYLPIESLPEEVHDVMNLIVAYFGQH